MLCCTLGCDHVSVSGLMRMKIFAVGYLNIRVNFTSISIQVGNAG